VFFLCEAYQLVFLSSSFLCSWMKMCEIHTCISCFVVVVVIHFDFLLSVVVVVFVDVCVVYILSGNEIFLMTYLR